jgi:hypothetical protein
MIRTLAAHLRAQWMGALSLFLVIAGGTAYAANTVFSTDIVNGEVKTPDLASNAVGTGKVANNSLTGSDIVESSLGEVPSATLGGLGGETSSHGCDPEGLGFINCGQTSTITLAAPTRVLIIGQIGAQAEQLGTAATGLCHIGSNLGFLPDSEAFVHVKDAGDSIAVSGVTDVLGPGPIAFGLDCNEVSGGVFYNRGHLSYVELSPGQP